MVIRSLRDLYFDELAELYDAENQAMRILSHLADAARAPELRDTLSRHCQESRLHLERLELNFTHWSERRRSRPSQAAAAIVQEADDRLNRAATEDVRDAAIIGAAQRIQHYTMAAYGCARTYAQRLNRGDEARLLQETLDEVGRADRRLTELADAHINDDARLETDFADMPARPLHVVRVGDGRRDGSSLARLAIRSDAGEELGTLDGLLVDSRTERAKYAVVDAGGLLSRRRYLLPVGDLRLDADGRTLYIAIDKDIAERYPEFDADQFESMDQSDRRDYERHLAHSFAVDAERRTHPMRPASESEWWMTGAWVTVAPGRAAGLTDEARSFANEFSPNREHVVAREESGGMPETVTPPHGDKLR